MFKRIITILLCVVIAMPSLPQTMLQHPWQGKRVAYLGDSITDPRNNAAKKKYWSFLKEWLGIIPYVYAVSGRQWNDIPRQADKCWAEHGDSIDAVIIFMGTNDYNVSVPLGSWYNEQEDEVMAGIHEPKHMVKRLHRTPAMDKGTYRGSINIALDKLKRMYPTKQIVILTPIHRGGFYPNDSNWQPTEDYANAGGEFISAYVEASKEAADIWAVPVIDISALSGLYPMMDKYAQYFYKADTDRLHPNEKGHERMARTLLYQLSTIPCIFE